MRVNVYAEEMTERIEIIAKEIDGHAFTGLRLYLELPVTVRPERTCPTCAGSGDSGRGHNPFGPNLCHTCNSTGVLRAEQAQGPFMHRPGDDDSSAVTFWGKRDLRVVLRKMLAALDAHYAGREPGPMPPEELERRMAKARAESEPRRRALEAQSKSRPKPGTRFGAAREPEGREG